MQATGYLVAVDNDGTAMLGLIEFVAIESILWTTLTSFCRVGQHNGAIVQKVLDLAVEIAGLDIDVLSTCSLYV